MCRYYPSPVAPALGSTTAWPPHGCQGLTLVVSVPSWCLVVSNGCWWLVIGWLMVGDWFITGRLLVGDWFATGWLLVGGGRVKLKSQVNYYSDTSKISCWGQSGYSWCPLSNQKFEASIMTHHPFTGCFFTCKLRCASSKVVAWHWDLRQLFTRKSDTEPVVGCCNLKLKLMHLFYGQQHSKVNSNPM